MTSPALIWFRNDLRLADNPALSAVADRPLIALYILDVSSPGLRPLGAASRWWLAGSLRALDAGLRARGGRLILRRGDPAAILPELANRHGIGRIVWNRRYHAGEIAVDRQLKAQLQSSGVEVNSFQASLLHEPWIIRTQAGEPFRVFTPFWNAARTRGEPRLPMPAPQQLACVDNVSSDVLEQWSLEPTAPNWATGFEAAFARGEEAARQRLTAFIADGLKGYAAGRDRPDLAHVSRLSPHLRFGDISPFQLWHAIRHAADAGDCAPRDGDKFLSELGWREFCWHLAHHWPDLERVSFQPRFEALKWRNDPDSLHAWQQGRTGIPIVDAGMRQLWQTGWMHNRVRMIVASFLTKNLLIDWRAGERWFWDTLVDADTANNPAGWQWVAGCGADAAPYFRIFNPVLQGEKFDPDGAYVRSFVPELAGMPARFIHKPWLAPQATLAGAGIRLGTTYPAPSVDLAGSRARALAAFAAIRTDGQA